jgi:hypothetical protein
MVKIIIHIIKGYSLWIWYYLWKPYRRIQENEANRKIQICEKCEHFEKTFRICSLCGCLMDIKVKSASNQDCYDEKW